MIVFSLFPFLTLSLTSLSCYFEFFLSSLMYPFQFSYFSNYLLLSYSQSYFVFNFSFIFFFPIPPSLTPSSFFFAFQFLTHFLTPRSPSLLFALSSACVSMYLSVCVIFHLLTQSLFTFNFSFIYPIIYPHFNTLFTRHNFTLAQPELK